MPDPIVTPAAPPTPAAVAPPITPAVPPAAVMPPAVSPAPAKTILEQAGESAATAPSTDELHEAAYEAIVAFKTNEDADKDDALETAMNDAIAKARKASADAKAAPKVVVPGAPEKYVMTPSEKQTIDEALLTDVSPILKTAGLTNDQLNQLMPVVGKVQEKAIAAYVASQTQADIDRDAAEQRASKEALGAKFPEQLALVAKARDRFFSAESKVILNKYGNNIHLINDLVKLGKSISEGKLVDGKPVGQDKSAGAVLFDNTK